MVRFVFISLGEDKISLELRKEFGFGLLKSFCIVSENLESRLKDCLATGAAYRLHNDRVRIPFRWLFTLLRLLLSLFPWIGNFATSSPHYLFQRCFDRPQFCERGIERQEEAVCVFLKARREENLEGARSH